MVEKCEIVAPCCLYEVNAANTKIVINKIILKLDQGVRMTDTTGRMNEIPEMGASKQALWKRF